MENSIRPFCVGRRNWLFNGNAHGAYASAALYSLVQTALANKIEPYRYLRYIFHRLPRIKDADELKMLLPENVKAEDLETASWQN